MKRRAFMAGLASAAVACPIAAHSQRGGRERRIGVLTAGDENDPGAKRNISAFTQALANLGWTDRNVGMDIRWGGGDASRMRALAHELVGLKPDIILVAGSTVATAALQRETQTVPIVFANVADPVASGLVAAVNQPAGNITGFALYEVSLEGKWLELLSEITPALKRATIMFNPDTSGGLTYLLRSLETAARSLKVVPIAAPVHSDAEIEAAIIALGREPGGGLVVMPNLFTFTHRAPIISAAARNNVPAVYGISDFARAGGLLSYGADPTDLFRRAATYVDRILRGAKPADLPVQFPTKYEIVLNLKTAKALALTIPPNLLALADEVIE